MKVLFQRRKKQCAKISIKVFFLQESGNIKVNEMYTYETKQRKTEEALKLLLTAFDLLESSRTSVSLIFFHERILFLF